MGALTARYRIKFLDSAGNTLETWCTEVWEDCCARNEEAEALESAKEWAIKYNQPYAEIEVTYEPE